MTHPREDPTRRCLKLDEWPEPDRTLWLKALQPGSIVYGGGGVAAHLRPDSVEKIRKGYGRWLTFLTVHLWLDPALEPASRITPEWVWAYVQELQGQVASWTVRGRIAELHAAARMMAPERDWGWLRDAASRLEAEAKDAKPKLPRMRSAAEIYDWAQTTLNEVAAVPEPEQLDAVRFRDALIIAVAITTLLRRRNLTMIVIGQNLLRRGDHFVLEFKPSETKPNEWLVRPLPIELAELVELYLHQFRPMLAGPASGERLWLTQYGRPFTEMQMYHRITKVTRRAFGIPINPHLFRHCAATTVAVEFPEEVGVVPGMLGHSGPKNSEKYYIQADAVTGSRRLAELIERLRKELPSRRAVMRRRRRVRAPRRQIEG